jgi:glycosyltransferase involved in cell wall biosynthesis
MNKVLIISYYFTAGPTAAGLSPLGLARHLPEFGWKAVVLTSAMAAPPDLRCDVVSTKHYDSFNWVKKLLKLNSEQTLMAQIAQLKRKLGIKSARSPLDFILAAIGEVTAYPDLQKGWRRLAVESGKDILKQQGIKAIISISPPGTAHIISKELKDEFKIPWVADFQDLWTQNYYYPYSPLRRMMERRLELKTLSAADAIVTVSEPAAVELGELHKHKVYSIPRGFDLAEVNHAGGNLTSKFSITYTGNVYPNRQSPEPLFAALYDLISQRDIDSGDIEVRFYGAQAGWIEKMASRYKLTNIVKQFGPVPREIALAKQRESQLLLLLKWNDPRHRGVYTAKVFEYLAARRPVIAVGGYHDVVNELLDETGAGVCGQTGEEIKKLLLPLYREYKLNGAVNYSGSETEANKYSFKEMARKFAFILDSIL